MGYDGIDIAEHLEDGAYRLTEACKQLEKGLIDRNRVLKILLHSNRSYEKADKIAQEIKNERGIPDYISADLAENSPTSISEQSIDEKEIDYNTEDLPVLESERVGIDNIQVNDSEEYVDIDEITQSIQTEMENSEDPLDRISSAFDTYRKALRRLEESNAVKIDFSQEEDLETYAPEPVGPYLDDLEPLNT